MTITSAGYRPIYMMYHQISNTCRRHSLVDNKHAYQSDVLGTSPVGTAPTTSSFPTLHLVSMDWRRKDKKHSSFGISRYSQRTSRLHSWSRGCLCEYICECIKVIALRKGVNSTCSYMRAPTIRSSWCTVPTTLKEPSGFCCSITKMRALSMTVSSTVMNSLAWWKTSATNAVNLNDRKKKRGGHR